MNFSIRTFIFFSRICVCVRVCFHSIEAIDSCQLFLAHEKCATVEEGSHTKHFPINTTKHTEIYPTNQTKTQEPKKNKRRMWENFEWIFFRLASSSVWMQSTFASSSSEGQAKKNSNFRLENLFVWCLCRQFALWTIFHSNSPINYSSFVKIYRISDIIHMYYSVYERNMQRTQTHTHI